MTAPAPVPTAAPAGAPSGVIAAPNTGNGPSTDSDSRFWMLALALGAIGVAAVGGAVATKRR